MWTILQDALKVNTIVHKNMNSKCWLQTILFLKCLNFVFFSSQSYLCIFCIKGSLENECVPQWVFAM